MNGIQTAEMYLRTDPGYLTQLITSTRCQTIVNLIFFVQRFYIQDILAQK